MFDIGELYDAIRFEMLTYERATPFKQLGISRKQIIAEMFEKNGKIYTQIKIDEITNLGAVKIRLRSLLSAIGRE